MKKLNIYCGIRSIGWNVTEDDEVIDFGVKRVNVDFDSYYAFTAGLPVAKRIDRRMKRQARRNLWRYKTRREKLGKLLKSDGRYPTSKQLQADRAWLNAMRSRACIEKVDSQALGRVLIDLQRKRGYKSMRGVDDAGDSEYLETIAAHEAALKNFPTVGDYLASLDSCKNVILRRETYEAEYYRICEVQEIDHERYYGAIFRQRPLQKGKIAFCKLATNRKVTHQSNPNCQLFRILRDVNNIEIYDSTNTVIDISPEHRKAFIEHLRSGKDLTKAGALKIMGIKKSAAYTWYSGKSITGNVWGKLIGEKEDHPIPNAFTFQLWQDLISATDDNLLISILKRKYGYSHEQSEKLAGYDIKGLGYSEYSVKAINKLLPILKQGIKLNDAILDVYGKVDFVTGVRLRNVVLEQVHASCAALAKAIKAKHDVGEMQMEIDSLLKMGNKARKARATAQRRQEKDNAELNRRIVETGGEPSEYNRKKLRVWDDRSGVCPYFSDKKIEVIERYT
jgi:CRISPR-associated endonuclease Csn1